MEKKIKTVWQGKVGIHEKYAKECREKNEPLELVYTGTQEQYLDQSMTISPEGFSTAEVGKERYPEKQGNGFYRLLYFLWKADVPPQGTLL